MVGLSSIILPFVCSPPYLMITFTIEGVTDAESLLTHLQTGCAWFAYYKQAGYKLYAIFTIIFQKNNEDIQFRVQIKLNPKIKGN